MQIFSTGQGRGAGPVDYVTGPLGLEFQSNGEIRRDPVTRKPITYVRDPAPVVVAGDPAMTEALIDSLEFKFKYTSGVLSFAPEDGLLDPEKEKAVIEDFERVAFAGLDKDQYDILWVRHTHQDRHELHFIVPRVELATGKSLNIAPPNYQKYFDPWRSLWNARENWAEPDDPDRSRVLKGLGGHEEKIKAANLRAGLAAGTGPKQAITDYLIARIEAGMIENRAGIVAALEEADLEINRQSKDYLSVRIEPGAKPLRLKGVIYEQDFKRERFIGEIATQNEAGPGADRDPGAERIADLERDIEAAMSRRAEFNRGRYQSAIQRTTQEHRSSIERTPEPGREFNELAGKGLDNADSDRPEPLSGYLRRELGPDALDYARDFEQSGRDSAPIQDFGGTGEKGRADQPELLREDRRETETLRPDRRERAVLPGWLSDFKDKIRGIYDRARTAIDRRIEQIISAIRGGANAAETANRDAEQASSTLEQTSANLDQCAKRIGVIRMNRADELDAFKSNINLVEYAAGQGYQINQKESSRNSKVMEKDGDKIVIATGHDGHGVYFSVRDDADNGSVIDFVQRRKQLNLGQVRKELRGFAGHPEPIQALSKPVASSKDVQQVIAVYAKSVSAIPRYLTSQRGIDAETVKDPRFASVVRVDANKNAVFPHFDSQGLCGFELKNESFTGFARGGRKGLWHSSNIARATKIVICESAIDALSHAQLRDDPDAAYVSIGGSMNDQQPELIRRMFKSAAERDVKIILAMDNDDGGRKFVEQMRGIANETVVLIAVDMPKAKDWNAELVARIEQERQQDRGLEL